jgi:aminoglycoside phosphotransferase (APT) family kinase protein
VADEHGGLVEVTPLTTLLSPDYPGACWRLVFRDGTVAKGRRVTSAGRAERCERLIRLLEHPPFPRVRRRAGSSMVLDWIPGRTPAELSACHAYSAGEIQGTIHTTEVSDELVADAMLEERGGLERLSTRVDTLVQMGLLEEEEGRRALDLAREHRPAAPECGLMHGDFCAENFIVDDRGVLWVIDNETLKVNCLDYDLAKTCYRWPMSPALRREYLRGYRQHRSTSSFEKHFHHFIIRATVSSAYFRAVRGTKGVDVPIAAFREFLAAGDTAAHLTE